MSSLTNMLLELDETSKDNFSLVEPFGKTLIDFLDEAFSLSKNKYPFSIFYDYSTITDEENKNTTINKIPIEKPTMKGSYSEITYYDRDMYNNFLSEDSDSCPLLTTGTGSSYWWLFRCHNCKIWIVCLRRNNIDEDEKGNKFPIYKKNVV